MDIKTTLADIHKYEQLLHEQLDKLHYYNEHGTLPPQKIEVTADMLDTLSIWDLVTRRANLLSKSSRNRKDEEKAEKVEKWKAEAKEIEEMLKRLGTYTELWQK